MTLQTRETMRDIYPNLVNQGLSGDYPGTAHGTHATPTDKYAATIYALFGKEGIQLSKNFTMGTLDRYEGYPHSTTGLPYALHGTATVINQNVTELLAGYEDPIKAIMPVAVHKTKKIIIRRKFTVGGQVTAVPERSAARTVGIQEDEREVVLTRYGVDIEMNLNLFHQPELAKQELGMKMKRQQDSLNDTMTELGYEALMQHGVQLPDALMRSNPLMGDASEEDKAKWVEHIYTKTLCFAMAKSAFPIPNLLAAAGQSSLYAPSTSRDYVMIVPHGMMELEKYTKETTMVHSISGVPTPDGKPVNMPLSNVQVHQSSGLKIMTHVPTPSMRLNGNPYPQAEASGLTSRMAIAMYYHLPEKDTVYRITDFKNRVWKEIKPDANNTYIIRPRMEILASSAILAVPGSETGELLMAYPSTGISTSQTTETMKMQLRVYMGAVVHRPDNVIILPDIMPNGVKSGHGATAVGREGIGLDKADGVPDLYVMTAANFPANKNGGAVNLTCDDCAGLRTTLNDAFEDENAPYRYPANKDDLDTFGMEPLPMMLYKGRVDVQNDGTKEWTTIQHNNGHLETLDDPHNDRIHGLYRYQPDIQVTHK